MKLQTFVFAVFSFCLLIQLATSQEDDTDVFFTEEPSAYAVLTIGPAEGGVLFTWDNTNICMNISGEITKLTPGYHGFHVHTSGDLRGGCTSAGGHYNPEMVDHAGPTDMTHHVGDLGNIVADQDGTAIVNMCVSFIHTTGEQSVIGRSIVVHSGKDDLGVAGTIDSLSTGNSGSRVGCGIIGLAN